MKKVSSVLLIIVFVLSFAASPCFSGFAFASSPVTWEDLGEDAIALRDSYYELWSSSGNFSQLFKSAADIPVKWLKTLADGALVLSPVDDLFFTYEEAVPVVQSSTPKGKAFIDKHKISADTPVISSDDFSDKIEEQNSEYTPKGELDKISYRTDDTFQKWTNFPSTARKISYMSYIIDNNRFVSSGGSEEMYFLFFYNEDGTEFISEYQGRLYFEVNCSYDENGSVSSVAKYPRLQVWNNVDGSPSEPIEIFNSTVDCSEYKYYFLYCYNSSSSIFLNGYKTYSNMLNDSNSRTWSKSYFTGKTSGYTGLYSYDMSSSREFSECINGYSDHTYYGNYLNHSAQPCKYNDNCDIGLYVSSAPIDFTYRDIDTTKIPSGQIVTINGDTIYNYNITNPETGDTSKFGDYITNNYTYITNNYGGESGGSGSGVSGNVTVGGSIDVGGSVGVDITVSVPDININVNGNGGAGVSPSLPDTDLVENLPEVPSGFIDYTASLFSFLPAEILSLLIAGLAAAIFCRIWGR